MSKRQSRGQRKSGVYTPKVTASHCVVPKRCSTQHPGEVLKETMTALRIKKGTLVYESRLPLTVIDSVLDGKSLITPDIARKISFTLGIAASFWVALSSNYEARERKHAAA